MQYRRNVVLASLGLAGLLGSGLALALEVKVQNASGEPVSDVVLLVEGASAQTNPAAVMDQIDRQFQPNVLVVAPQTQVNFPNSDDVRHHVYSFSPANRFELRLFEGGEAPPVPFDQAGVVVLGCNIHDQMIGYVLVDPRLAAVSDQQGLAQLGLSPGTYSLEWWHPSLGETAPQTLGEIALQPGATVVTLPVRDTAKPAEKSLSPLQQRFRKATGHATH